MVTRIQILTTEWENLSLNTYLDLCETMADRPIDGRSRDRFTHSSGSPEICLPLPHTADDQPGTQMWVLWRHYWPLPLPVCDFTATPFALCLWCHPPPVSWLSVMSPAFGSSLLCDVTNDPSPSLPMTSPPPPSLFHDVTLHALPSSVTLPAPPFVPSVTSPSTPFSSLLGPRCHHARYASVCDVIVPF